MSRDYSNALSRLADLLQRDFCTLSSSEVQRVLDEADEAGYRKPKNANGSRGRYFHALLQRRKRRES